MRTIISLLMPALVLGYLLCGFRAANGQEPQDFVTVDADSVVAYLQSCRKQNGAFGPHDQEYTDAAWNCPAVHALQLLGESVSRSRLVLEHGLGSPPGHVGYGHWQFFHEHQIRALLQEPFNAEHPVVEPKHQGFEPRYYGSPFGTEADFHFKPTTGSARSALDRSSQQFGYYNLSSLYYLLAGLRASQRKVSEPAALVKFICDRQAPGGGFVDVRMEKPEPRDNEAHVTHTFQAIASLKLLGEPVPNLDRVAAFVHSCQRDCGGFGRNSNQADGEIDVYYTWAAVRALELLSQRPRRIVDCTRTIRELQNADGGFGDRTGWRSRLYSTYYAVHALQVLHGDPRKGIKPRRVQRPQAKAIAGNDFNVYQALFKMPVVQPQDLPELSNRGFHLLGLKSAKREDAHPILTAIRDQQLKMDVILTPEAYPH